jgi:transcription elongation GreA/GreB family factor
MAVAFTREEDYESQAADLPDRPIPAHPNLVTAAGLAAIEAELAAARAAHNAAPAQGDVSIDRTAMARATRDLRYWAARRASAQLTEPSAAPGVVQFGRTVQVERADGRRQTFRVVGSSGLGRSAERASFQGFSAWSEVKADVATVAVELVLDRRVAHERHVPTWFE